MSARPIKRISRETELMMLTMLVAMSRANPHKHKQAIESSGLVKEAKSDLTAILIETMTVVDEEA